MDDDVRALGELLGAGALKKDWAAVHSLLAPWLRASLSVDAVRAFFEDEYRRTLSENGIEGTEYPEHPEPQLDGNSFMTATKLREPISFAGGKVRSVPPEVTDANLRYWLKLQLLCSDAQMERLPFDSFCEIWAAVVATADGVRIGYWSHGAY